MRGITVQNSAFYGISSTDSVTDLENGTVRNNAPDHPLNVDVNSLGSQMAFLKVRQFEGPYGRFRKRFVGEGGQAIADFNGDGTNDLDFLRC